MKPLLLTTAVALLIGGCNNHQIYDSLQGAKQDQCNKIIDDNERRRCFDEANKHYDQYKKERDELKRPQ